jgi:uncharacterized protein YndB with AHSA1/START domain
MASLQTEKTEAGADAAAEHTLRITRVIAAPREKVFRAWADPAELAKWWGPKGMTVPLCEMDVRPGGAIHTCMRSADGEDHSMKGVYREVTPPERIVLTWCWQEGEMAGLETLVTVEFRDRGASTELVLTHEGLPSEAACEAHNQGWSSSFECLDEII